MFIKKISVLALGLLFLGTLNLHAGILDERNKPGDDKKKKIETDDTTRVSINHDLLVESENDIELNDSILMFPSHDLYSIWDTSIIHPYSFIESFKSDSVTIALREPTDCGFIMPYQGEVTSEFGWRKRRPHYGTDINLETGDTVVCAFDGMVRIAKLNRSYGNVVIIRHKNGLETVYAHLSKILVEPGQIIQAGDVLGLGGNTGHSYGSHLHFEMRYLGQALDAEDFIDFTNGSLKTTEFTLRKSDVENKYDLRALHGRHKRDLGLARSSSHSKVKTKYYTIRKGDTLNKIAKRNHTTIKAICSKNGIKQSKKLKLGQKLRV